MIRLHTIARVHVLSDIHNIQMQRIVLLGETIAWENIGYVQSMKTSCLPHAKGCRMNVPSVILKREEE